MWLDLFHVPVFYMLFVQLMVTQSLYMMQIPLLIANHIIFKHFLRIIPDNALIHGISSSIHATCCSLGNISETAGLNLKNKPVYLKPLWWKAVKINNDKNAHDRFGKSIFERTCKIQNEMERLCLLSKV